MAWILRALELYKSFVRPQDTCPMENLAPSKVRDLLHEVLRETAIGTVTSCGSGSYWLFFLSTRSEIEFLNSNFS
jgi:hypothetical protein